MTVKELMTTGIFFVKEDASAFDAATLMKKNDIGIVPVCDEKGVLLGLLTDRSILLGALQARCELTKLPVSQLMSPVPASLWPEMNIHDAACLFSKEKMRRLPVVENGRLVGMLSITDLARRRVLLAEVGDIAWSIAKKENSR